MPTIRFFLLLFFPLMVFSQPEIPFSNNDKQLSSAEAQRDLLVIEQQQDDSLKVIALNDLAWELKNASPGQAFKAARLSFRLAGKLNYLTGIANASHTLGMLYWYQGDYLQASDFYFKALDIRQQLNDQLNLARSYNNVGNVYFRQEKYDQALRYYSLALNLREAIKDSTGLIYSYNNLGDVYLIQLDPMAAYNQYEKALEIATQIESQRGMAFVSQNIGEFYLNNEAYLPAIDYFKQTLALNKAIDDKNGIAESLNLLAKTLILQKKNPEQAIAYAKEANSVARAIGAKKEETDAQSHLAEIYALKGNYAKAYQYELASRKLDAEIVNEARERAMVETELRYELDQQESQLLHRENELLQKDRQVARLYSIVFLIVLLGAIASGLMIYYRLRNQASNNLLLAEKNDLLEQSNQALERFAYVASHDLKEPLRSIGSFSTLLKRRYSPLFDQDGLDYINFIVTGVDQMYTLLNDLLQYSRLIHQKEQRREQVDLNEVLAQVTTSLDFSIKEKKVKISSRELPVVSGNPIQMQQLFQNLVNNAIKFNDKSDPEVAIECKNKGREYVFSVKDNGLGIEPEYQTKIFEVFHRLSRQGYNGTGVGLAICKKIVEQHEGHIWVESEEGKGSTFYFTIPDMVN